jgi:glutamine synthetase
MFKDSSEVLKFIKDEDVKFLDIRFTDLPGVQQHFNIPASTVDEEFFTVGQLFDGSSIRGFANIHESDMQLIPDVSTAYLDPFREAKTLIMLFDIYNPRNGEIYSKDPRQVAKKAEKYLASTGIADTAFFAPEAEFYIFDDVRYEVKQNASFYSVDSEEGAWNTGRAEEGGNLANKTPTRAATSPSPPSTRRPTSATTSASPHRVGPHPRARAPRGRHRWSAGDQLPLRHDGARGRRHPEVQVHRQERRRAVGQGRDLHAEAALRRQRLGHAHPPVAVARRQALFYDEKGYGGLSDLARWYIGGLLAHAPPCSPSPTRR